MQSLLLKKQKSSYKRYFYNKITLDRLTGIIGARGVNYLLFKQIKDLENSYVVADDIEVGFGNKIPLWLFGFLY